MKEINLLRDKIKKPPLSSVLSWAVLLITLFTALIADAPWWVRLVAVVVFMLTVWREIMSKREQKQQLGRERERGKGVAQDLVTRSTELRSESNLNRAPDTMPTRESQIMKG